MGFPYARLGLLSILPKDTPTKTFEDPVQLEPRTPGLRVKHCTTEPRRTPEKILDVQKLKALINCCRYQNRGTSKFKMCFWKRRKN